MSAGLPTWDHARARLVQLFAGELPLDTTERAVLEVWRQRPEHVENAARRIAGLKNEGAVRSAWAVLRADLENLSARSPEVTADPAAERAAAVDRAEVWLRNAGRFMPTEAELLDELFGRRGRLRLWDTPDLRARMVDRWQQLAAELEAVA